MKLKKSFIGSSIKSLARKLLPMLAASEGKDKITEMDENIV